jgi:cullin 3
MIILELFNLLPSGEYLTAQDIQATTNIPQNDLYRNLQSLSLPAKTRILKKDPMVKEVNPDDKFYFNDSYKSQFLRVKVGVVALANRVETERERLNTERTNDDSRKLICEAAIVRIMKYVPFPLIMTVSLTRSRQRQELDHQRLIAETISQLSSFKPEVSMIKNRIESLIEREYLERFDDGSKYRYLA